MADLVLYAVEDGVAMLTVAHPPVNALTRAVRAALIEALDRAEADDGADAIVLIGQGTTFPAGAELAEYETGPEAPSLRDLCDHAERCEKPVVAALSGTAYGGGLDLALAAHYRIAARGTRLALPEIRLGLPPSGGASQRLPRLVGAQLALDMMLKAQVLPADRPPGQGLVDAVADGALPGASRAFARRIVAEGLGPRRLGAARKGFADMGAYMAAVETARQSLPPDDDAAPNRIVSLVEAAPLLPLDVALDMEQDAFESCRVSVTAQALRHAFIAERAARRFRVDGLPDLPRLDRIAVLGAGPLAVQIVLSALNAGMAVNWGTRDSARMEESVAQLRALFDQAIKSGTVPAGDAETRLQGLRTGDSAGMAQDADVILHAARGQGDVPAPPDVVRMVAMPSRVDEVGLRFPPPVFQTRLVEVLEGPGCVPAQIATALALADRMGKVPVHVKSTGDSIAGRLAVILHRAADAIVEMGADPYAVDEAVARTGWAMRPFQIRDLGGLAEHAQARRADGALNWSEILVEAGRTGRAGGGGFYDWIEGRPERSPDVMRLIDEACEKAATFDRKSIVPLLVGALAAEGARMLEAGMAQTASDIDTVALLALGFPRWQGGPMKAASLHGLFALQKRMERFGHPDPAVWDVGTLWRDLVKNGRSFDGV